MSTIAVARGVDPRAIAGRLLEARDRTFLLLQPAQRRGSPDSARSPDEPYPLGSRAHSSFRGALADPQPRGPGRVRRDAGLFNPFEHPRSERGALRLPGLAECQRDHGRDPGQGAGPAGRDGLRSVRIRCCEMAMSTTWCFSTSTSTTRPSSRPCSSSGATLLAGPPVRSRLTPESVPAVTAAWSGFPVAPSRSAPTTGRPPTTTSAPGTSWSSPHSGSIGIRSPMESSWPSSRPAAIRRGHTGPRADGNGSPNRGLRPRCTGAGRTVPGSVGRWTAPARCRRPSGLSRVLSRGRGVRPLCREAPADGVRMGSGRVLGSHRQPEAQLSLGRAGSLQGTGQRGPAVVRHPAGRELPAQSCRRSAATA